MLNVCGDLSVDKPERISSKKHTVFDDSYCVICNRLVGRMSPVTDLLAVSEFVTSFVVYLICFYNSVSLLINVSF